MYVGAVLGVFGLVSVFAQTDDIREQIEDDNERLTESEIDTAVTAGIGFAVVLSLVVIGLWIWMAVMNKQGRTWARVTATVFGAINIGLTALGLLFGATLGTADTGLSTVLGIVSAALAGVILVFLWQPESTRYYEQAGLWGPSRY